MFGNTNPTFGSPASSAFGQSSSLFGAAAKTTSQTTPNLFGQPTMSLTGSGALFGGTQTGTISWGANTSAQSSGGTAVAFNPPVTTDTIQSNNDQIQVTAKQMCITAMSEYRDKSIEELRLEDYALNRTKGSGALTNTTSLFGTSTAVKPFQFNTPQSTATGSIFGQANKSSTGSIFGASNLMFGGSTATTQPAFGQAAQSSQGSLLGLKPQFGGTTTQTANIFGTAAPAQTNTFAFGQQPAQTNSLFGARPMFGAAASTGTGIFGAAQPTASAGGTTGFAFGQTQPATTGLGAATGTTNLFGAKPNLFGAPQPQGTASGLTFGSNTTGLFGTAKTAAGPTLFGAAPAGQQTQQSAFGFNTFNKPAGTGGFFGTTPASTTSTLGKPGGIFGTGTGFGAATGLSTAQTPAFGGFGQPTGTSASLFGQPATTDPLGAKKTFGLGWGCGTGLTAPAASTGLFGIGQNKPATGLFGPTASTGATTGFGAGLGSTFGNTGTLGTGTGGSLFGQPAAGGLGALGQKPIGTGFGTVGLGLGGALGGGSTGTGLFGGTGVSVGIAQQPALGLGTFGQTGLPSTGLGTSSAEQLAQSVRAQQQVLEMVRSMPYGQSSLFRYINTSTSADATKPSNVISSSSGTVSANAVPAKAVAAALAEQHRSAGLTVGAGSPVGIVGLGGAAGRSRRAGVAQRLLQVQNRNQLFSGFYEEDVLLSSADPTLSPSLRARRTFSLTADPTLGESPSNFLKRRTNQSFFVRRDDWRQLHVPESVRTSILERSVASSQEFTSLAEAALNDNAAEVDGLSRTAPGGRNHSIDPKESANRAAGDTVSPIPSTESPAVTTASRNDQVVHVNSPRIMTSDELRAVPLRNVTPVQNIMTQGRRIGMMQAREALQAHAADDSVLIPEDLDSTWGPPNLDGSRLDNSVLDSGTKSPSLPSKSPVLTDLSESKTGIQLKKPGYYTLPTLDELAMMIDSEGRCIVDDFVIGRRNYGHILFPGRTDLTDLNLDDIVHIRRREVVVYPDDLKKPPIGFGLNKRAEVCLESIWPTDKTTREPIKSAERLLIMRFEERLERATRRMDARYIEYRPESGSWVFEVKHFSKYRLEDSDEEDNQVISVDKSPVTVVTSLSFSVPISVAPQSQTALSAGSTRQIEQSLKRPSIRLLANQPSMDSVTHDGFLTSDSMPAKPPFPAQMMGTSDRLIEGFGLSARAVQQMRTAFFSPRAVPTSQTKGCQQRAQTGVFFSRRPGDDEDDELDEQMSELDTESDFFTSKRLPTDFERYDQGNKLAFITGQSGDGDDFHPTLYPTPEKISRMSAPFDPTPTKSENLLSCMREEDDVEVNDILTAPPTTPFRPIRCEPMSEGVPLESGRRIPPISSALRRARLPVHLKSISDIPVLNYDSACAVNIGPYPYQTLSNLLPALRGVHRTQSADEISRLTHLLLDTGLTRGHGMRPSWGHLRCSDLHSMALVSLGVGSSSSDYHTSGNNCSSFAISLHHWAGDIELMDEDLLNAALATSSRQLVHTDSVIDQNAYHVHRDRCPLWQPVMGLGPLEHYARVLRCESPDASLELIDTDEKLSSRLLTIRRLVSLCMALWGAHPQQVAAKVLADVAARIDDAIPDDHSGKMDLEFIPSLTPPSDRDEDSSIDDPPDVVVPNFPALDALARKQAVSEWIRAQSFPWLRSRLKSLELWNAAMPFERNDAHAGSGLIQIPFTSVKQIPLETIGEAIFACLVAGEPGVACRLCLCASMPALSSLVAQSTSSDPIIRRCLQRQMAVWQDAKAYTRRIPLVILRVYALIAGQSHFMHPTESRTVTVLAGLDWTRVFGAYLWYLTDYTADLSDVLRAYSRAWHPLDAELARLAAVDDPSPIARPVPPRDCDLVEPPTYHMVPTDFPKDKRVNQQGWPRDTAYHLLQLFRSRSHSLERTLDPCSIHQCRNGLGESTCKADASSLLDWSPSWNLWRILHALGYQHFISSETASRICSEFASQLENANLWEWAVFVLLHESDLARRETSVKTMLARHVSLVLPSSRCPSDRTRVNTDTVADPLKAASDELDSLSLMPPPPLTKAEEFIVFQLGVPFQWLHEAKAILARHRLAAAAAAVSPFTTASEQSPRMRLQVRLFAMLEASHWLAANHVKAAHAVCMHHLLPDIVLHTDLSVSRNMSTYCLSSSSAPSVTRLGHLITRLMAPFDKLPLNLLPDNFELGAGVYRAYGEILCLTEQLGQLCQTTVSSTPSIKRTGQVDEGLREDGSDSYGVQKEEQLASTMSKLRTELSDFAELVQHMLTPNLNAKVVKMEMAATCAHLISAFLAAGAVESTESDNATEFRSATLNGLHRQLLLMTKIGLPAEHRLKELRILAEAKLALGVEAC